MFKRVMVSVVGIPLLILLLSAAPDWAAAVFIGALCGVAAWEFVRAAGIWPEKRGAVTLCAGFLSLWLYLDSQLLPFLLFLLLGTMFAVCVVRYERGTPVPFAHLSGAAFAALLPTARPAGVVPRSSTRHCLLRTSTRRACRTRSS